MTTTYHTPLTTGAAANASVVNAPLATLDAQIAANTAGLTTLTAQITAALDSVILSGAAVTLTNGTASAGQKVVTVDSTAEFVAGCYVEYLLVGGVLERNTVATKDSPTQLTLTTNIGAGGIGDNVAVGVIPRGLANASAGTFNVLDYGAVGNGSTDDTAAIQAALGAAHAYGSGRVTFPYGSFKVTTALTVGKGVVLQGVGGIYGPGTGTTLVSSVAGAGACVRFGDGGATADAGQGAGMRGIAVSAGTGTGNIGIHIYGAQGVELHDVYSGGFTTGTGVKVEGGSSAHHDVATLDCSFRDLYLFGSLVNLYLTGTDDAYNSSADEGAYDNVRIYLNDLVNSTGVWLEKTMCNHFKRLSINSGTVTSGTTGIKFTHGTRAASYAARENQFDSVVLETLATGISFSANTWGNLFHGLHITDTTTAITDASGNGNLIELLTGGQNLTQPYVYHDGRSYANLLRNSEQERWESGASVPSGPGGWWYSGTGAAVTRDASNQRRGTYCAKIVADSTAAEYYYAFDAVLPPLLGRWVSAGAWVKASDAASVDLRFSDSDGNSGISRYHSGGGAYEYLTVRYKAGATATWAALALHVATGKTAYLDAAILVEGTVCPLPSEAPLRDAERLTTTLAWNPDSTNDGAVTSVTVSAGGAAVGDPVTCGFTPAVPAGALLVGAVTATDTVTVTLFNKTGTTLNLGNGTLRVDVWKH
jgi:hypothetical protein